MTITTAIAPITTTGTFGHSPKSLLIFNEANYEHTVISLLESIGYTHLYGPDIERDYHNHLYLGAGTLIEDQITRINPEAHSDAIEEAINKITRFELELRSAGTLVQQNKTFMDYLQNGVEVSYQDKGQTKNDIINAFCITSDFVESKVGTITSGLDCYTS